MNTSSQSPKVPESGTPPASPDGGNRRRRILELVDQNQFVSIRELGETLGVSVVTVRADVDELARDQSVRRVRGGVMKRQLPYEETPYEERSAAQAEQKAAIATAAVAMVESNATLILDVGTTAMAMARALVAREDLVNVTVFTNGVNIALALERAHPRISTIVTGGTLRPLQHSLVEPMATLMLQHVRAGTAYIGCNGVDSEFGVTATNLPEAAVKQAMIKAALRVVVIADSSKFGRTTLARICAVTDVDCFVTGRNVDRACTDPLQEAGCELVLVD